LSRHPPFRGSRPPPRPTLFPYTTLFRSIDLPAAEPDRVKQQIEDVIGLDASDAIPISAKSGLGVPEVLEALVKRLPPPKGDADAPLQALLVDSWYDPYLEIGRAHV